MGSVFSGYQPSGVTRGYISNLFYYSVFSFYIWLAVHHSDWSTDVTDKILNRLDYSRSGVQKCSLCYQSLDCLPDDILCVINNNILAVIQNPQFASTQDSHLPATEISFYCYFILIHVLKKDRYLENDTEQTRRTSRLIAWYLNRQFYKRYAKTV